MFLLMFVKIGVHLHCFTLPCSLLPDNLRFNISHRAKGIRVIVP